MSFLISAQSMREVIFKKYAAGIGLAEYNHAKDAVEVWEVVKAEQLFALNRLLEKCEGLEELNGVHGLVVPSDLFTTEEEKGELETYLRILGYEVERDDGKIYFAW